MQGATHFRAPLWPKAYGPSAQINLNLLGTFMSKKSLYLASAALALFAAGNAYAVDLTGTGKYAAVKSGTGSVAVKLAEELRFTATATSSNTRSTDNVTFQLRASTGNSLPNDVPLVLKVDLTNAIFNAASTAGAVVSATGGCVGVPSPLSGVQPGATSASYLLTLSGCSATATAGLDIALPIRVTGAGAVSIGAELTTQAGNLPVDGGRKAATFVELAKAFDVEISTASASDAVADLNSAYKQFTLSNAAVEVGSYTLSVKSGVFSDLSQATNTANAALADVSRVLLSASADKGFAGFNLYNGSAAVPANAFTSTTATIGTTRTFTVAAPTTATTKVYAADNTGTGTGTTIADLVSADGVIVPTNLTLTATVDLVAASNDTTTTNVFNDFAKTAPIKGVVRNGASFVAPWVALGATSANSTVRLANNGGTATGPIQVTLLSHNGSSVTSKTVAITADQIVAGSLNTAGGIPAGSAVSISGAALKAAFGTDAANGDIQVSVEAQPSTLSGKVRVTQASGQIFETSLGNIGN